MFLSYTVGLGNSSGELALSYVGITLERLVTWTPAHQGRAALIGHEWVLGSGIWKKYPQVRLLTGQGVFVEK